MDLDELRANTPGCGHRIHLNNAGAALMPEPVLAELRDHLELESRIGGYEAEAEVRDRIEGARTAVGELVGAHADRIAFAPHATAAFATALSAVRFEPGDLIATTRADYVSNQIAFLSLADRFGVEIVRAPDAPEGGVDLPEMEALIHRRRPKLVAVTHATHNSGLVQDVETIGRFCRARDVLYLVDACQSVGQMPIDVQAIGCDFLSATARKFMRGPRGVGFLFVADRVLDSGLEPLFVDMRGADWVADDLYQTSPDARRFESWEFAWGLVLGMGAAARYGTAIGLDAISERVRTLAARLRSTLREMDDVRVLDRGPELGATVTLDVRGHRPADLVAELRQRGINTSWQRTIDALIDYEDKGVDGALRVSPHYYNVDADLDAFVDVLTELTGR